jgi:hypothetical protein
MFTGMKSRATLRPVTNGLVLGAALLAAGLPAMAAEGASNNVAVAAAPHALLKCPGLASVPMTADAEQSLPMKLVANLVCGQNVTVLSDAEGYTAHVRTTDGKEGFVAVMYLAMGASAPVVARKEMVSVKAVNGVARWQAGAAGCDQFQSNGHVVQSMTANGITVQISLQDTGWKLRANVAVSNQGIDEVEVVPGQITLDELQPSLRSLHAQDPTKLGHVVNHGVFWTEAMAQPSPSAVAMSNVPVTVNNATYRTVETPDYMSEHLSAATPKNRAATYADSADIKALALKAGSLPVQQKTAGVVWFERDANARELSLRIPVGDVVFDFPLSFEQKN